MVSLLDSFPTELDAKALLQIIGTRSEAIQRKGKVRDVQWRQKTLLSWPNGVVSVFHGLVPYSRKIECPSHRLTGDAHAHVVFQPEKIIKARTWHSYTVSALAAFLILSHALRRTEFSLRSRMLDASPPCQHALRNSGGKGPSARRHESYSRPKGTIDRDKGELGCFYSSFSEMPSISRTVQLFRSAYCSETSKKQESPSKNSTSVLSCIQEDSSRCCILRFRESSRPASWALLCVRVCVCVCGREQGKKLECQQPC